MRENKTELLTVVSRSGGNVTVLAAMDVTALEESGRGTEYEIDMTGNIAV